MQDFKKLEVWFRAYKFSLEIYKVSMSFPTEEKFGLTAQLRKAATSIPINIAEGSGKVSDKDFANYIQISIGSASEVECELMLTHDLGFLKDESYKILDKELKEIRKMLYAFRKTLLST